MPEFEDTEPTSNHPESYTPSTDASKKPSGRRRSGGFKTEVASASTGSMGEVNASDALKSEKLSGNGKPADADTKPRQEREERAPRADKAERAPRKERAPREPREEGPKAIPQPSAETLAAIATVETRLTERRSERDARRAEREKNRPAKQDRKPAAKKTSKKPQINKKQGGLLAAITGFFGKLFGKEQPAPKKKGDNRGGQNRGKGGNRVGRPQGKGGNRGGQNRGKGRGQNRGKGGNRGGQNRRGKGGGEKRHTAASLSNES